MHHTADLRYKSKKGKIPAFNDLPTQENRREERALEHSLLWHKATLKLSECKGKDYISFLVELRQDRFDDILPVNESLKGARMAFQIERIV